MIWKRAPEHDRRIRRGDDFAGDAWRDLETGKIKWVAVGRTPLAEPQPEPEKIE